MMMMILIMIMMMMMMRMMMMMVIDIIMIKPIWRVWRGRELVADCKPSALCDHLLIIWYLYLYLCGHLLIVLYLYLYLYMSGHLLADNFVLDVAEFLVFAFVSLLCGNLLADCFVFVFVYMW